MGINEVLILILLVVSIVAIVYLINILRKLGDLTEKMSDDITEMKNEVVPAIQKLNETLENTSIITGRIERRSAELDEQLVSLRDRLSSFGEGFSLGTGSQNPVQNLVGNIKAVKNGFSAFWSAFRK
ncbi:MAG: hypothetical protein SCALA702_08500 [Melioribacteraceae bacterium]|nr:MAG: hypothetical protein SCALA702_08500 [Melioribacteraceae bacterium]